MAFTDGVVAGDKLSDGLDGSGMAAGTLSVKAMLDIAIETYYDDMRNAVRRRGLEQSLATEVVHDVYVQLARQPERLSTKSSVRAFLMRAAINLGIDRQRRMSFEKRLFAVLDAGAEVLPAHNVPIEDRLDMARRIIALRDAICELPQQCRNVFIAHRIGGLDKDEIAEGLGIRRRMVDRHLRNALIHCMERMESFE